MADSKANSLDGLMQAYNQAISGGFAAANEGIAQTGAAVKLVNDAIQTERNEYGKAMEQAATHARNRSENFVGVMQGMASVPPSPTPSFSPEMKESVNKLIEGEMAFYQALTKGWMDYLAGVESRRNAATRAMLETNARVAESGQAAVKNAAKYGEAFIDWSMEAAKVTKS